MAKIPWGIVAQGFTSGFLSMADLDERRRRARVVEDLERRREERAQREFDLRLQDVEAEREERRLLPLSLERVLGAGRGALVTDIASAPTDTDVGYGLAELGQTRRPESYTDLLAHPSLKTGDFARVASRAPGALGFLGLQTVHEVERRKLEQAGYEALGAHLNAKAPNTQEEARSLLQGAYSIAVQHRLPLASQLAKGLVDLYSEQPEAVGPLLTTFGQQWKAAVEAGQPMDSALATAMLKAVEQHGGSLKGTKSAVELLNATERLASRFKPEIKEHDPSKALTKINPQTGQVETLVPAQPKPQRRTFLRTPTGMAEATDEGLVVVPGFETKEKPEKPTFVQTPQGTAKVKPDGTLEVVVPKPADVGTAIKQMEAEAISVANELAAQEFPQQPAKRGALAAKIHQILRNPPATAKSAADINTLIEAEVAGLKGGHRAALSPTQEKQVEGWWAKRAKEARRLIFGETTAAEEPVRRLPGRSRRAAEEAVPGPEPESVARPVMSEVAVSPPTSREIPSPEEVVNYPPSTQTAEAVKLEAERLKSLGYSRSQILIMMWQAGWRVGQ